MGGALLAIEQLADAVTLNHQTFAQLARRVGQQRFQRRHGAKDDWIEIAR
jgi:hypothetical protein